MLANIGVLALAFSAAAATVGAASIEERGKNNRPLNAKEYFDQTDSKLAEYIYFGGLGKYAGTPPEYFCSWWHRSAKKIASPPAEVHAHCVIVDYKNSVAAVYATQFNHDGHPLSQTGPVGYSENMRDTAFVSVQTGPSYKNGGTCDKIVGVKGWCRNKFVPHFAVDLTTVDADGNDVDGESSFPSASSDE